MISDPTPDPGLPVNHVFVDGENVHEVDLTLIGRKAVHLTLLLGAQQTKLKVELVERLMTNAASVQLVRLESSGKDALDFTLAYYLGRAVQADPSAHFHIVSKDGGFKPLIEHLRKRHIHVHSHKECSTLTFRAPVKLPEALNGPANDLLARAVEHLLTRPKNLPKTKDKLAKALATHLRKDAPSAKVIDELIDQLKEAGRIKIGDKEAVSYHL
jgi:hypothetical protein